MYQKEEGNEARFPLKDSTAAELVDSFDDVEDIELVHSKHISRYIKFNYYVFMKKYNTAQNRLLFFAT